MQKLSLKVWNECCQVFLKKDNENDAKETRKIGLGTNILIKSPKDIDMTAHSKGELDHARSLFVMTKFDMQLDDVKDEAQKS